MSTRPRTNNSGLVSTTATRAFMACAFVAWQLSCGAKAPKTETSAQTQPAGHAAEQAEHSGQHWGYAGATGPEHWGDLTPEYATCKTGTKQTPADIVPANAKVEKTLAPITFNYQPMPLKLMHNGHTIQVTSAAQNFIQVGEKRYDLVQFHFHSGSEHTVSGKRFDMELHLVHKDAQDHLAVVGILLQKGKENAALKPVWDHMPAAQTEKDVEPAGVQVDLRPLFPNKPAYYTYDGSLTTPPCTEGVTWFVLVPTADVSEAQITKFQSATGPTTSRPVQPLNGRIILQFQP